MKQEDLFKKLGLILNELNEQYQFLAENPQQLSELELELFHANANFLADHVQIIKKINNAQQAPLSLAPVEEETVAVPLPIQADELQEESQVEAVAFADEEGNGEGGNREVENGRTIEEEATPEIAEIEEEIFKLDQSPATFEFILNDHAEHEAVEGILQANFDQYAPDDKFEYEEKEVDELFNRPLSEEEEEILAKKRKLKAEQEKLPVDQEEEEDEIGPEPFLVTPKEKEEVIEPEDLALEVAPIAETKVNTIEPIEDPNYKPTLNELLAKGNAANLNATSGKSITDLKQAISLNDKLLYIKDLFNGYNLAYSEAIDIANRLPNFEAADNFFQKNYAAKNNWSEKQATVDKFYSLLNQRFK